MALVFEKKAACGTAEIGAGLAARGFVWSLVPAKRVWRLIFMVRAVIIAAGLV